MIWTWTPGRVGPLLQEELSSWEGTPYMLGQQCKGAGVDCVRFVCGVLDALTGKKTNPETLPPDVAMHSRETAINVMRKIKDLYSPNEKVTNGVLKPGDVIVTGPRGGGPGHAMIVGARKNEVWHAGMVRICRTSIQALDVLTVFRVYRILEIQ